MQLLNKRPFLIAEISANHCGSINIAKKLIDDAKKFGADAVKFQTFTPETMTLNSCKKNFLIKEGIWKGNKLWDIYKQAQTHLERFSELFLYCKKHTLQIILGVGQTICLHDNKQTYRTVQIN